ncbi:MAG: hypothetical protein QXD13_00760 [Candidatus Pacearchaeota archaeon]
MSQLAEGILNASLGGYTQVQKQPHKMEIKKKKAQEEIVGFVVIVVIVAIIGLVFLGITIRKSEPLEKKSKDVSRFLESAMDYTTNCAIRSVPDYSSVGELLKSCYMRERCISGQDACDVLKADILALIESAWRIGPDRYYKGYIFNATYVSSSTTDEILSIRKGNCSVNLIGGDYITPSPPGNIKAELKICY